MRIDKFMCSMSAHRRIRNLARTNFGGNKAKDGDASSTHTSECSICLMPVAVRLPSIMSHFHPLGGGAD